MSERTATVTRETAETTIDCRLAIDGEGEAEIDTGIGFLDHMLTSFVTHGLFDLELSCEGDLAIDDHHTVEDCAIVLGTAIDEALDDRAGIVRFADRRVPLDEAVASVVVDVGGRPRFYFEGEFSQDAVGEMASDMARHFAESFAMNAGITLHAEVDGENAHHEIEALFKAIARTADDATRIDDRREEAPSTKGTLTE
ncbi:imidazoleglycerol-phosphate dehydratase HisB [Saliphagus infecundisoli]|uniref:Imidazoleglycerol-phosphate dehydratase n=1 Tax=Saliphagus infecundisoli TaxID=1849069 RepID=A0ABD5QK63_9EURY|nr:imidazoleglycerol-phosphate dehydratase HisB [Saliphagus infecundisoli]